MEIPFFHETQGELSEVEVMLGGLYNFAHECTHSTQIVIAVTQQILEDVCQHL